MPTIASTAGDDKTQRATIGSTPTLFDGMKAYRPALVLVLSMLSPLAGCSRSPSLPEGFVVGLEPVEGQTCIAYETVERRVWWWDGGSVDCLTASSSVQDGVATVQNSSLRIPSLRITLTLHTMAGGTHSIEAKLSENDDAVFFLTEDGRMVPTRVMTELDLQEGCC